jgi:hypothetical protein
MLFGGNPLVGVGTAVGDDLFGALGLSVRHNLGIAQEVLNDVAKAA